MNALTTPASILVVDDEPHLRNSLCALLSHYGYASSAADDGRSAIEVLEKDRFDLVLLDLCMTDVNGQQVMQWITDRHLDTSVIVVSGDTSIDSAINAFRCEASDFLRKPYEADELVLKIGNVLSKRRLEKENRAINQQLKESERWYRYMVNSSPDFMYTLDAEGYFTYSNDRVDSLLGYRKDEVLGKHFLAFIHAEDREAAQHIIQERRTHERAPDNIELRIPHGRESTLLTLEFNAFAIYDDAGSQYPGYMGTYGVARDITERKKAAELYMYQAYHDLLTGLANRRLFKDRLELAIAQARRYKYSLALMFLDLDRFKVINDTLGHSVGDNLLIEVAARLKNCVRKGDTLARQGGDEFTLLLPQVDNQEGIIRTADKINRTFSAPFHIDGHELYAFMSIGIALFPEHGDDIDTLIKNADIAMYHSKANGRNRYQIYAPSMNVAFDERFSLEMQLHKALERNEFQVVYQPQINIGSGRISGMEALLRWQSPILGYLSPMEFIPLAEETGLIVPIGEFVLRSAFSQARLWQQAGLLPQRIAINISSLHLAQDSFVDFISRLLQEYTLPGSIFEMEITENVLLKDSAQVIEKLHQLAGLGVKIALDDFGTGYSSLSYLKKFPIHTIKIDRSFMPGFPGDSDNESIVTAICVMGRGLKLNLIAEGVEEPDQYRLLQSLQCDEAQGFLFSKPLSGHEITEMLVKDLPLGPGPHAMKLF